MNQAQIEGAIRTLLVAVGGVLTAVGYAAIGSNVVTAAGAVVSIGGLIWSLWSNRTVALVAQVAKDPAVIQVITSPAIAAAVPSSKVVPLI